MLLRLQQIMSWQWLRNLRRINKIKGLKFSPALICFLAGVMYTLPYYFEFLFVFSFVSLTVFFYTLLKHEIKNIFLHYFLFFCGFYFSLYAWLVSLYPFEGFDFNETQRIIIVALACIAIPLFHSVIHSAIMWATKLLPKNKIIVAIGTGITWVVAEWVLSIGALAFPWGTVALSQTGFLPFVQTASLFGPYFIALLVISSAFLLAHSIKTKSKKVALVVSFVLLTNLAIGSLLFIKDNSSQTFVDVAILQGNVSSFEKWQPERLGNITEIYSKLAEDAAEKGAEIIVMPESAIPSYFSKDNFLHDVYSELATKNNCSIVSGVLIKASEGSYNSVITVYRDGSISNRYDKRHLVPFGEYIPYKEFFSFVFPFIDNLNLGGMKTIAGDSPVIMSIDDISFTSLVCFDSIFPELAREPIKLGARALIIVTNDSWFKDSAGIYQHLRHAQLRAIENGVPVIRAANTGISAFISPNGKITSQTEALAEDLILQPVIISQSSTLYNYTGDIVIIGVFLFWLAIIVFKVVFLINFNLKVKDKEHENE